MPEIVIMNPPFSTLVFDRFIFRQGQLLDGGAVRAQHRLEADGRWMQNAALHNGWGVAIGYAVGISGDAQQSDWARGEVLTINPGIAYDCYGRELILAQPKSFSREKFEADGNISSKFQGRV